MNFTRTIETVTTDLPHSVITQKKIVLCIQKSERFQFLIYY